jgi:two-component system sensor histidine kinase UhpB
MSVDNGIIIAPAASVSAVAKAPRPGIALGDFLWRRRSVRGRLLITILLIDLIAAIAACGVIIFQTRTSVQVEVASSMKLADLLVQESIQMQQDVPAERILPNLPLQLRFLRHVRIAVHDLAGLVVTLNGATDNARGDDRPDAPSWFAALMAVPVERHEFAVEVKGRRIGSVIVTGEPKDEIAEAWEHTAALGLIALTLNAAGIGLLYLLFGRVLEPVARLAGGLADLERRHYEVRLPPPGAAEFAAITARFNALAEALHGLQTENRTLNRRLITVQDDERRNIALELHDEVGPSLFGLKAMASSAMASVGKPSDTAKNRLGEMLTLIEHMQATNRNLLNRLRPMALGHVPLENMLSELIRERGRQHPQLTFSFSETGLQSGYGDSIDLTVYRCVQESLTNAMKHAGAQNIDVKVAATADALALTIRDDGRGIDPAQPLGFGRLGMQERVEALGGECTIESESGRGTAVRIRIPLAQADQQRGGLS